MFLVGKNQRFEGPSFFSTTEKFYPSIKPLITSAIYIYMDIWKISTETEINKDNSFLIKVRIIKV